MLFRSREIEFLNCPKPIEQESLADVSAVQSLRFSFKYEINSSIAQYSPAITRPAASRDADRRFRISGMRRSEFDLELSRFGLHPGIHAGDPGGRPRLKVLPAFFNRTEACLLAQIEVGRQRLVNVRFGAYCGLKSHIATGPKSANSGHWRSARAKSR